MESLRKHSYGDSLVVTGLEPHARTLQPATQEVSPRDPQGQAGWERKVRVPPRRVDFRFALVFSWKGKWA